VIGRGAFLRVLSVDVRRYMRKCIVVWKISESVDAVAGSTVHRSQFTVRNPDYSWILACRR